MVSMIANLEDGDGTEGVIVGNDGLVGLPRPLDADRRGLEGLVQMAGTTLRIPADAFRVAIERLPEFCGTCEAATRWPIMLRWRAPAPATATTTPTSASRAGC
jgi:hypothetical protein